MTIKNFEVVNSKVKLTIDPEEDQIETVLIIGFKDYPFYDNVLDVSINIEDYEFTIEEDVSKFDKHSDFLFSEITYIKDGVKKTKTLLFNNITKYKQCLLETTLKDKTVCGSCVDSLDDSQMIIYMSIRALEYAIDIGYFNKLKDIVNNLDRMCGCFKYINESFNTKCNEYDN